MTMLQASNLNANSLPISLLTTLSLATAVQEDVEDVISRGFQRACGGKMVGENQPVPFLCRGYAEHKDDLASCEQGDWIFWSDRSASEVICYRPEGGFWIGTHVEAWQLAALGINPTHEYRAPKTKEWAERCLITLIGLGGEVTFCPTADAYTIHHLRMKPPYWVEGVYMGVVQVPRILVCPMYDDMLLLPHGKIAKAVLDRWAATDGADLGAKCDVIAEAGGIWAPHWLIFPEMQSRLAPYGLLQAAWEKTDWQGGIRAAQVSEEGPSVVMSDGCGCQPCADWACLPLKEKGVIGQ